MSTYYMSWNKNEEILLRSASGGIFTALSEYVLDRGGAVFGAARDEDAGTLITTWVTDASDLDKFRRSKYYQSEVSYAYRTALEFLKSGKWVLFSGTPCQNAGLLGFLKLSNQVPECCDNLITVDVLCHGISNRHVYETYIADIEKKYKKKVVSQEFRSKEKGWRQSSRMWMEFEDGSSRSAYWKEDPFYLGFNCNLTLRPSCHTCDYSCGIRCTDFSIGDYWGIEDGEEKPDIIFKGVGLTLVNTDKAGKIWNSEEIKAKIEYNEIPRSSGIKKNGALIKPATANAGRYKFMANLDKEDFTDNIKACLKKELFKNRIKKILKIESIRKIDYSNIPVKCPVPPADHSLVLEDGRSEVRNSEYNGTAPDNCSETEKKRYNISVPLLYEHKADCYGCYACMNVCPVDAISMKSDKEGFMYPIIDARTCVRCRKCVATCPRNVDNDK